jgi:hypothetical protein
MEWQKFPGQKMKTISTALLLVMILSLTPTYAWNNHAGITYLILQDHWRSNSPNNVKAESLEDFILKEKSNLPMVLGEIDSFISEKLPHCPKPSDELLFVPENVTKANALVSFYRAIRVNPAHKPTLYVQSVSNKAAKPSSLLDSITSLSDRGKLVNETFVPLTPGKSVSPQDIIVTAVDEPDYDLDLYLFTDNDSEVGKLYGFGEQAFGNPKYEYSSQAPFHMGFYHESALIFTMAGFLKRTYPEYRIYQFTKLSEFAFKTGHPYWGYRFAGWALHYLQDLTQPYHSSVLPRVSAGRQIGVQLLAMVGLPSSKTQIIEFVTARHTLIEEYQYYLVKDLIQTKNQSHIVFQSLAQPGEGLLAEKIDFNSIRNLVSQEAYDASIEADLELENLGIVKYENLYAESHPIHQILAKLLRNTSRHTRSYLDGMKKP